jgi:hypothetical protein
VNPRFDPFQGLCEPIVGSASLGSRPGIVDPSLRAAGFVADAASGAVRRVGPVPQTTQQPVGHWRYFVCDEYVTAVAPGERWEPNGASGEVAPSPSDLLAFDDEIQAMAAAASVARSTRGVERDPRPVDLRRYAVRGGVVTYFPPGQQPPPIRAAASPDATAARKQVLRKMQHRASLKNVNQLRNKALKTRSLDDAAAYREAHAAHNRTFGGK